MKICFIIGELDRVLATDGVIYLALEAHKKGHEVYLSNISNLSYSNDAVRGQTRYLKIKQKINNREELLKLLQEQTPITINYSKLDIIFFRTTPEESTDLAESKSILFDFGRKLKNDRTIVINDPEGVIKANSKLYPTYFSKNIIPETLISRDQEEIMKFLQQLKGKAIIKPLQGSGGKDVFLVKKGEANLKQIIETVTNYTYAIVQEYLSEAKKGDKRILILNGRPIYHKKKCSLYIRKAPKDDIRSNIHVGGIPEAAELTETDKKICQHLRPRLVNDGLYFVGIDVIGDKVVEVNVYNPGGLHNLNKLYGVDFSEPIIKDLEKKVFLKKAYRTAIDPKVLFEE